MARSLNANFEAAISRAGSELRYLLELTYRSPDNVAASYVPRWDNGSSIFRSDITTQFNDATDANAPPYVGPRQVDDYMAVGYTKPFYKLVIDYANGTAATSGTVAWEYYNGSGWSACPGISDGTNSFKATAADGYEVTWTEISDWATTSLDSSDQLYYVRARVTATSGAPDPTLDQGWVSEVTHTAKALSGACEQFAYPAAVHSAKSYAIELDPLTRDVEIGSTVVTVRDAWIRPILASHRLRGQRAKLKVGEASLAETDFVDHFVGPIDNVLPTGNGDTVELELIDALAVLRDQHIVGYWIGQHPVQIIDDIIDNKVRLVSGLVNTTSTDVTQSQWSDISHFTVSATSANDGWYVDTTIRDPVPALDVIRELTPLLNAGLFVDEAGQITLKRYDPTAAADDSWDEDDFVSFSILEVDSRMINRVSFSFGPDASGKFHAVFTHNDTDSQAEHAYPGTTERIAEHKIESDWVSPGKAALTDTLTGAQQIDDTDTSFFLRGESSCLFAGTNGEAPATSQPAWAQLSGSKPAYWLADTGELIKCTSLSSAGDGYRVHTAQIDPEDGSTVDTDTFIGVWNASSVTRGVGATTAVNPTKVVHDATIPVLIALEILQRFGNGIHVVSVSTNLRKYAYEVGDMINLTWVPFLASMTDGLSSDKFEIIGKETDWESGEISWTLASTDTTGNTVQEDARAPGVPASISDIMDTFSTNQTIIQAHLPSGGDVSQNSGLNGTVAESTASAAMSTAGTESATFDFEASKDTYIYASASSGSIVVVPVASGTDPPAQAKETAFVAKVETDATTIQTIDQSERETKAVATQQTSTSASTRGDMLQNGTFVHSGSRVLG